MKKLFTFIALILLSMSSPAQKTMLGDFCYYESINSQKVNGETMPYSINAYEMEIEFKSGYHISIKGDKLKNQIAQQINSRKKGTFKGGISYNDILDNIILNPNGIIEIDFDASNCIIKIPEIVDFLGHGTAPSQTIFIPKSCIPKLVSCLKKPVETKS